MIVILKLFLMMRFFNFEKVTIIIEREVGCDQALIIK